MGKDSEIRDWLIEKKYLLMAIVTGVTLLLAIVIIVILLKLSFFD